MANMKVSIFNQKGVLENIVMATNVDDIQKTLPDGYIAETWEEGNKITKIAFPINISMPSSSKMRFDIISGGMNYAEWVASEDQQIDVYGGNNETDTLRFIIYAVNDITIIFSEGFKGVDDLTIGQGSKSILEFKPIEGIYFETLRESNIL